MIYEISWYEGSTGNLYWFIRYKDEPCRSIFYSYKELLKYWQMYVQT